jgi:hypothetical protein
VNHPLKRIALGASSALDRSLPSSNPTSNHRMEPNESSRSNCQSESRIMYAAQLRESEFNPHRSRLQPTVRTRHFSL